MEITRFSHPKEPAAALLNLKMILVDAGITNYMKNKSKFIKVEPK